jgi:hypothetical protein
MMPTISHQLTDPAGNAGRVKSSARWWQCLPCSGHGYLAAGTRAHYSGDLGVQLNHSLLWGASLPKQPTCLIGSDDVHFLAMEQTSFNGWMEEAYF